MVKEAIHITEQKVWQLLDMVADPDIPVISIVELGLVRKVKVEPGNSVTVTITPSYSGCPAMHVFRFEIESVLKMNGVENVKLEIVLSPAWTTDWLSDTTKNKLKQYGIAPPVSDAGSADTLFARKEVPCPRCNSYHTKLTSQFGSTPCKALWYCEDCMQPFEYFKCH
ncbi:MAG: phenylacetate-CoA oxygenase subunit PaaJ [Bacteroidetes bacterium]|jgi:ring-1,2-phenylacetyl-CoA epoxidase subunit PaaD|nr:phenylacetate-CoA oxygenase subunit PaaJ [Bacteroidota bacterium]